MKKKLFALLLAVAMLLSLTACATPAPAADPVPADTAAPTEAPQAAAFTPGAYTASADGRNGPVTVEVVFSENAIDSVTVTEHSETAGIADPAIERIPAAIVAKQSLAIDAVSGCTLTSDAIVAAVTDCLMQAGGDPAQWSSALEADAPEAAEGEALTCDVVIAGGGVAGLSAAIEALDAGASVILVEKMASVGGSTALSEGRMLAAGSYVQKALGIEDSPELFAQYLMNISQNKADPEFINIVAESSAATIDWLVGFGVQFADEVVTPVPDMQPTRGLFPVDKKGTSIINPLLEQFEAKGGTLLLETPATDLLTDESGAVTGLTASRADGSTLTVSAGAVVLATGGFTGSPELMAKYAPSYLNPVGNAGPGNTGDGLLMAERVGADILANDCLIAQLTDKGVTGRWDACGLFVSPEGKRFMNENLSRPRRARACIDALGQVYPYYIHDESEVNDRMADAVAAGTAYEASSVAELAEQIGADPAVLQATLDRYNELCAKGVDDDFGKDAAALKPIDLSGKLYAIRLTFNCAGTTGGPRINTSAQVLNKSGEPIPGLYAAGEVASGSFFANEYPGSGAAIQCYTTFGRIAGQNSAKEALAK